MVTNAESDWFLGATTGTNNTGELIGVIQALLWLRWCATDEAGAAIVLCDSCYAMDAVEDRIETTANVKLIELAKELLSAVRAVRTVTFVHVLGHSDDPGNERADELVQWGKQEGPYARLRTDGGWEGQGWQEPAEDYEERKAARIAAKAAAKAARRTQQEGCAGVSPSGLP